MLRLNQIIRNLFIRVEGLLYQFFSFFKNLFGWLIQLFSFLGRVLGFRNEVQSLEVTKDEPKITAKASPNMPPTATTTRRRPDPKMEDFLKMARQVKISK